MKNRFKGLFETLKRHKLELLAGGLSSGVAIAMFVVGCIVGAVEERNNKQHTKEGEES